MPLIAGAPTDFSQAVAFYLETIKRYPELAEAYFDLGEVLYKQDLFAHEADILTLWSQALQLRPQWPAMYPQWTIALRTIGGALISRNDQLEQGKALLRQLILTEDEIARTHPFGQTGYRIFSSYNVPQHFGHTCLEIDLYLKMTELGWLKKFHPLLLVQEQVSNPRLVDYWSQHVEVVRNPAHVRDLLPLQNWLRYDTYFVMLPDGQAYPSIEAMPAVQMEWDKQGRAPLLKLWPEDYDRGQQVLRSWGIPAGAWFACIHARETATYKDHGVNPTGMFRNADIDSYKPAIEAIVEAGGWVVRMGDPAMKPLGRMPNTIDYAHSAQKSDWMDVFLSAECRFLLGSQSGMMNLPSIFGRPCAITNWAKLSTLPCFAWDVFIMKNVWLKNESRALTWDEFLLPPYSTGSDDRLYYMGVEMHPNTPEDIRDLTIEMIERTGGGAIYTADDDRLQLKARKIFDSAYSTRSPCRVGREFLRKYSSSLFRS